MGQSFYTYPLGLIFEPPKRRRAALGPGQGPGLLGWATRGGRTAVGGGSEVGESKEEDKGPEETSPRRDIVHHSIYTLLAFLNLRSS